MFRYPPSPTDPLRRFVCCNRASVAVTAALALPALLGIAGLAIEFGDALVTRAETQRVADLAVHAGVLAYALNSDIEQATLAARNVARLNGLDADGTSVVLDQVSGGPVVRVVITTPRPLILSQLIAASHSVDVTVRSAAMLEEGASACILALAANGSGITMSGGTSIATEDCAVASNASVTLTGGASIVTDSLSYDSDTPPSIPGGTSVTSPGGGAARITRASAPDPLEGHAALDLARSRLALVANLQLPTFPASGSGPNIEFGWNATPTTQAAALGCSASRSGSTWTFGCPSGATVNLGRVTVAGGIILNFGIGGSLETTYNIARGIETGGGTTTTFGAGTFRIGPGAGWCGVASGFSICNTSTMVFGGPSVFELAGGIRNTGNLMLGTGVGNSFRIGKASNGMAIMTSGGSCLAIGAAENHDIAGHLDLQGGVILGSGVYTIDGYLHLGANAGGSVTCWGESVSLRALDVTLVLSGKGPIANNQNCNGQAAFCAASGYSSMRLVAPASGPFANMAVIGPLTAGVSAGASFGGGASGSRISGAFYIPNGPITMTGGADAGSGTSGGCLQIIGATVTMSGGTTTASECDFGGGVASGQRVRFTE